jgi:hypothetical protein
MKICRKMLTIQYFIFIYLITNKNFINYGFVETLRLKLLHEPLKLFYKNKNQSSNPNYCEKSVLKLVGGKLLLCREQSLQSLFIPFESVKS